IEPKKNTQVDDKKDKATIAFLYQALTEDVILQIAGCETAKELWESLKRRHVGEEKVQQARLQSLMIGIQTLQMKEDDTVDAFTPKLNGYATKAREFRKTLDESLLVRKLLDSTPDRFIQIVASIEQTNDLDDITLDEITGKLKAFEERINSRKEDKWKARKTYYSHKANTREKTKGEWDLSKVRCFKCQKLRHYKKDCIRTSTTQEQSNLILEDNEPSLLMTTHETKHEEVLLNEGQIQPGKYASADASIWYLDNGASNHMTGTKSHFRDINERITGRIRFRDRSYVQIKGRGSILLGCKNNEQKIVSDVYYIPNLKSNIISLGQLTEIGCKIIMDGNKLTLYDKNKKLLIKVERSKNRIYSTRLQIEAPICLLATIDNQAWLWHARLGHLNFDDINKMTRKGLVEGTPRINHAGQTCDAYLLRKHSRTPFPNQAKLRSKNPLDLVYGDLCGPISPATHSGKKLFSYKTPYEALYNRKPNLENLRIFGCTAYAKITIPHLKKLDDRTIPMIYLGVKEGLKACRIGIKMEDTNTQDTFWTSSLVEGVDNENATPVNTEINDNITYQEQDSITDPDSPVTPPAYTYNPNSEEEEKATISSLKNSEDRFDDTPMRGFKDLIEIYQNACEVETKTLLFTEEEPCNYKEASTDKK
nr:zinc finger, CCHC-type [Tanacetum cinerariifolium]